MIIHLTCVVVMGLYLYHSMCWYIVVVGLGLVSIYRRRDLTL